MTSEHVAHLQEEIKHLRISLAQETDETRREELKLQILGLQGQKLKSQIGATLWWVRMHEAAEVASSRVIYGINDDLGK